MSREDMDPDDKVPSKPVALRKIASVVAGMISAGGLDDLFGYDDENWTDAERDRLHWACEEIQRRLYAIGEPRRQRVPRVSRAAYLESAAAGASPAEAAAAAVEQAWAEAARGKAEQ